MGFADGPAPEEQARSTARAWALGSQMGMPSVLSGARLVASRLRPGVASRSCGEVRSSRTMAPEVGSSATTRGQKRSIGPQVWSNSCQVHPFRASIVQTQPHPLFKWPS